MYPVKFNLGSSQLVSRRSSPVSERRCSGWCHALLELSIHTVVGYLRGTQAAPLASHQPSLISRLELAKRGLIYEYPCGRNRGSGGVEHESGASSWLPDRPAAKLDILQQRHAGTWQPLRPALVLNLSKVHGPRLMVVLLVEPSLG